VAVAAGTFALFFLLKKLIPRSPAPLLVVAAGIFAVWYWGLNKIGVSIVGIIPQGLPPFTLPSLSSISDLLPGALGIALMSFTESIAVGRTFYKADEPLINANRELIATGAANALGGLFGAMPAGGGASQTAVVRSAGGNSQKANLVVAGMSVATLLLFAPVLGLMPNATLAAIVIIYSMGLIQLKEFIEVRKIRTMEFRWAVGACLGVLIFGTLKGIGIAIIMSLIGLASQTANPRVSVLARKRGTSILRPLSPEHPTDELIDGLLIVRPEGRVFFLNAQTIGTKINALTTQYKPDIFLLDMSRVPDIEYSALKMLIEGDKRLTAQGDTLWLAALNPTVLEVVRRTEWVKELEGRMFFNAQTAIEHYLEIKNLPSHNRREQSGSASL
jgi:MFS superfamily sulfate permease-like transporter